MPVLKVFTLFLNFDLAGIGMLIFNTSTTALKAISMSILFLQIFLRWKLPHRSSLTIMLDCTCIRNNLIWNIFKSYFGTSFSHKHFLSETCTNRSYRKLRYQCPKIFHSISNFDKQLFKIRIWYHMYRNKINGNSI